MLLPLKPGEIEMKPDLSVMKLAFALMTGCAQPATAPLYLQPDLHI
jgi:hypothetical protein